MSTAKIDSVIGSFLPIPVIEHATDYEVYTATVGQTVFTTTKFDRSNSIRAIAKSSGGVFTDVTATWTAVNTVTISGYILGAGQVIYIFKVGTLASKIRVQDNTGAWVDLSTYSQTLAQKGANSDITQLTGLTTALSVAQGGTGANSADAARASLLVPGRNRIINGDCRVAQRGTATFVGGTTGYGGPDRFFTANTGATGGTFTQSQGTLVDNGVTKNCVTQTATVAATDLTTTKNWSGITQNIEGFNCYDLMGSPVAVSFLFKASVAGTYSVAVRDGAASYSYVTTFTVASNVVTKVTISIPAIPASAVVPNNNTLGLSIWIGCVNSGTYTTSTLNAWQAGNYTCGSTSTLWATTLNATISVTDLQLESGTVVSPFERRSVAHEMLLCKRYFQQITQDQANYATVAGTPFYASVPFGIEMRVLPTATLFAAGALTNISSAICTPLSVWACSLGLTASAIGNVSVGQRVYWLNSEL